MKISTQTNYLFVYGTLRKGFGLHLSDEIKDDLVYVGGATINGELYDIGEYPAALPSPEKDSKISGEIYLLLHPRKVFKILDEYEGYDRENIEKSEYYRKKESLELDNGKRIDAWVYWYNFPVKGKKRIKTKDYIQYLSHKKSA
jgi:gamma-glutamylcyclotransferase (GGCT)/AIG2-like uncharacterized protein YtfP